MAAQENFVKLGIWCWGSFYETNDPKMGHIELAEQIIDDNGWRKQFESSQFKDPVDFLVFEKEAIKIGNQICGQVITLCDNTSGREVDQVLAIYESQKWHIEYVKNPFRARRLFYID